MSAQILHVPSADFLPVNKIGPKTKERCDVAARLWTTGWYDYVVVSGAMCQPEHITTVPDSFVMRDDMVESGVPEERILTDWKARDTWENAICSVALLHERGIHDFDITSVSHAQHVIRIWLSFYHCCDLAVTIHGIPAPFTLAEAALNVYHLVDKQGKGPIPWKARRERNRIYIPTITLT